jgi:hypothetical protein
MLLMTSMRESRAYRLVLILIVLVFVKISVNTKANEQIINSNASNKPNDYCFLTKNHLKDLDRYVNYCDEGDLLHLEGLMRGIVVEVCVIDTIVLVSPEITLCKYRGSRRNSKIK